MTVWSKEKKNCDKINHSLCVRNAIMAKNENSSSDICARCTCPLYAFVYFVLWVVTVATAQLEVCDRTCYVRRGYLGVGGIYAAMILRFSVVVYGK